MKNTLLSTALLTIMSTSAFADNTVQPAAPAVNGTGIPAASVPAPPANPSSIPGPQPAPVAAQPVTAPMPAVIDCKYHLPGDVNKIETSLLSTWAGKATVQSFNFNPASIDQELVELKSCYTDQGWVGFNDALQKSGNIEAIKTQHLTVSSQVDGEVKISPTKDNQWKVTVPLQVVYQNDKEKLTQLLSIDLLVGRKISGDLGIMQMIAAPRPTNPPQPATSTPTAPADKPTTGSQQPGSAPHP